MSLLGPRRGPTLTTASNSPSCADQRPRLERSRKRQHSRTAASTSAHKRTRVERPTTSPPWADHGSISTAILSHQIPSGVVLTATKHRSSPPQLPRGSFLQPAVPSAQTSPYYPPATSWDLAPPPLVIPSFAGSFEGPPLSDHALPRTIMYGHEMLCLPNCFGFARTPRQWGEGFASLVPGDPEPTNQAPPSKWLFLIQDLNADLPLDEYPYSLEKSEKEALGAHDALTPHPSTAHDVFEPYFDMPPQYPQSAPTAEVVSRLAPWREGQGMLTIPQEGRLSATNGVASLSARRANNSGTLVETRQPYANAPYMTYPLDLTYQLGYPWGNEMENSYSDQAIDYGDHDLDQNDDREPEIGAADQTVRHGGGGPSKRRPFVRPQDRIETAQTRKYKACLRCRMQKVRCNSDPLEPAGVCITCRDVSNLRVPSLGCLRYKITEIRLFKPGQVPELQWTQRWPDLKLKDIADWASTERRKIQTTEGFTSVPLELEVRRFTPKDGDILERHWWTADRVKKSVLVPAFAIADVKAARKAYDDYINSRGAEFIEGCLRGKDELIKKTYSAAINASNNPSTSKDEAELLKMVLRLWTAVRITTRSIRICGEDTLDMPCDILDETSPLHGEIPVPPVLGTQIELILIEGIQKPLRRAVLKQLQALVQANKLNTWFTMYLCTFILLHNCSMITKYDAGYAKKYIPNRKYARPSVVEECHSGANVLLAYWHYRNKGYKPFTTDNSAADFHARSELNPYQTDFVKETSNYVQANAINWKSLEEKQAYGHDLYFVSQLYEQDWRPRVSIIA